MEMASGTLNRPQRPREHHLVDAVSDEVHHLLEIEEKGDSPLTALIVLGQVMLGVIVIVAIETTVAMAFYLGWL
jgi:hypothetical protein